MALTAATSWNSEKLVVEEFMSVALSDRRGAGDDNLSAVIKAAELHKLSRKLVGLSCLTEKDYASMLDAPEWHNKGFMMINRCPPCVTPLTLLQFYPTSEQGAV